MAGFDVDGARKAGYSDEEIAQHLSKSRGFDYEGAKKSGYQPADVIQHLSAKPVQMAPTVSSTTPAGPPVNVASNPRSVLNPRLRNIPDPSANETSSLGALYHGMKAGAALASLPAAAAMSIPEAILGTAGGAIGSHIAGKIAPKAGITSPLGQEVSSDVGSLAGGAVGGMIPRASGVIGKGLSAVASSIDPDVIGLISPRAAHGLRVAGRVGAVLGKSPEAAIAPKVNIPAPESPISIPAPMVKPPTGYSPPAPKAESDIEMAIRGGVIANPEDQAIHAVKSRQAPQKLQFEDNTSQRILNNKAAKADMAPLGRPESPTLEQTKARIAELMQTPPPVEVRPTNGLTDEATQNAALQKLAPSMNQSGGYFEQAKDELGLPGDHPDVMQRAIELEQQAKSGRAYKGGPQSRDTTLDAMRNGTYKW